MIIAYNVQKNSHNDGYLWNARPTRQALLTRVPKMFSEEGIIIAYLKSKWSSRYTCNMYYFLLKNAVSAQERLLTKKFFWGLISAVINQERLLPKSG